MLLTTSAYVVGDYESRHRRATRSVSRSGHVRRARHRSQEFSFGTSLDTRNHHVFWQDRVVFDAVRL